MRVQHGRQACTDWAIIILMPCYRALLLLLLSCPSLAFAYSSRYEQRVAEQLLSGPAAGEVIRLRSAGGEYIALYTGYSTPQPQGAVVLVHGMGAHPDWPEVVGPLRKALPALGWATLSLQMPILPADGAIADYGLTVDDAGQRIRAAVQHLHDWSFLNIVVIGHSFGAATLAYTLADREMNNIKAFVGISMQAQQFLSPRLKLLKRLESISIPVLDIYGSRDILEVRREAHDRRLAAQKNGNSAYRQMVIEGADHYFTGMNEVLIKRIQGWLMKVSPGNPIVSEEKLPEVAARNPDEKAGE